MGLFAVRNRVGMCGVDNLNWFYSKFINPFTGKRQFVTELWDGIWHEVLCTKFKLYVKLEESPCSCKIIPY